MAKKVLTDEEQAALEKKEAEKAIREQIKKKRNDLSDWMVTFVDYNIRTYGQDIMDGLVKDDKREASRFITNLMRYAAPTATDPDKATSAKQVEETKKKEDSDAADAAKKVEKLSKQYQK